MHKRQFLHLVAAGLGLGPWAASASAPDAAAADAADLPTPPARLAMAWRSGGDVEADTGAPCSVGVLDIDWTGQRVQLAATVAVPSRAHGLLAEPDGGFIAVAARPGRWLLRCDAQGRLQRLHSLDGETPWRSLGGHITPSADGRHLYTAETDPATDEGWISVRDRHSLAKLAEWPTHGRDPHQVLVDAQGALMVANGGLPRTPQGQKRDLQRMASSLVRLAPDTGRLLGQWRLDDARLGLRHLAWRQPAGEATAAPLLGIGLQAEHDDLAQRRAAPALAVWDGQTLHTPSRAPVAGGYAGDIAPGPGGGFILSGQRAGRAVWWHPAAPDRLTTIAELGNVCALAGATARHAGVLLSAARGVARWHPHQPPAMLPWPAALAPDHHWVALA